MREPVRGRLVQRAQRETTRVHPPEAPRDDRLGAQPGGQHARVRVFPAGINEVQHDEGVQADHHRGWRERGGEQQGRRGDGEREFDVGE